MLICTVIPSPNVIGESCPAVGGDFDEIMLRHNYSETLVDSILFDNAYHFFVSL